MGYQVEYQPMKKLPGAERLGWRRPALTALCFVLFVMLVQICWPQGQAVLRRILFSGDVEVTAMALEAFAQELGQGAAFGSAFEQFCLRIVEGAKLAAP